MAVDRVSELLNEVAVLRGALEHCTVDLDAVVAERDEALERVAELESLLDACE